MSLAELEKVIVKLASEIKEDRVACLVEDVRVKRDKYLRPVVQLFTRCEKYGRIIFNYSPQKAKMFLEAIKKLGVEDTVVGRCFEFQKVKVQKMREDYTEPYPAWIPIKIIECSYVYQ